jgi:type VI secretion system secreted protein Hcp
MPGNSFICFDKSIPKGESLHESHPGTSGWIEISDWSWDIEADTSFLKGGGASVGKPTPGTLSFSHYYDLASPVIMQRIVQGTHFDSAHIVMLKQTGGDKGEVYFGVDLTEVFITKVSSKGAEDGSVTQDVECVFKTISVGYKRQMEDGKLDSTQRDFVWDIGKMKSDAPKADLAVKGAS